METASACGFVENPGQYSLSMYCDTMAGDMFNNVIVLTE